MGGLHRESGVLKRNLAGSAKTTCYIAMMGFGFFVRGSILLLVFTCISVPVLGEEDETPSVNFGVITGVPLQHILRYQPNQYEGLFSLVNRHDDDSFPIVVGPTVTFNITKYIGFEGAALYRPIRLNELYIPSYPPTSGPSSPTITRGSWWEFPLLGKVQFPGKTIVPFTKIGIVPHSEGGYFRITSTTGFALGGGVEWNVSRIGISPELRYSHWSKRYGNLGWSATPNRIDLLVGFTIH